CRRRADLNKNRNCRSQTWPGRKSRPCRITEREPECLGRGQALFWKIICIFHRLQASVDLEIEMSRILFFIFLPVLSAATLSAECIKVDLNPSDGRKDLLTPHWENWAWHEGASDSQQFGNVNVTFRAATNEVLTSALYKGLLDFNVTMGADGIVVKKPIGGAV